MNTTHATSYASKLDNLTANLTINKSRLKLYDIGKYSPSYVYMDDGTEFEIELSNNTPSNYLAVVTVNGEPIGESGLVLRPGERVFLERFLDSPRRFKFETYTVEDTKAVRKAIQQNGDVVVKFFRQKPAHSQPYTITYTYGYPTYTYPVDNTWLRVNDMYYSNTASSMITEPLMLSETKCCSSNYVDVGEQQLTYSLGSARMETGRVERGTKSNQKFHTVDMEFESLPVKTVEMKIFPTSAQALEATEIRNYCSECGRRKRKSERYCPQCGTKF